MIRLKSKICIGNKTRKTLRNGQVHSIVVYKNNHQNKIQCALGSVGYVVIVDYENGEIVEPKLPSQGSQHGYIGNNTVSKLLVLPKLSLLLVPGEGVHLYNYDNKFSHRKLNDVNNGSNSNEMCVVDDHMIAIISDRAVLFYDLSEMRRVKRLNTLISLDQLISNPFKTRGRIIGLTDEVLLLIDCTKYRVLKKIKMSPHFYLDSSQIDHKHFDTFSFPSDIEGLTFFCFRPSKEEEPYIEHSGSKALTSVLYSHGKNNLLVQENKEDCSNNKKKQEQNKSVMTMSHHAFSTRTERCNKEELITLKGSFSTYVSVFDSKMIYVYCNNVFDNNKDQIVCFEYNDRGIEALNEDFIERVEFLKDDYDQEKGIQYFSVGSMTFFKILFNL